MGLYDRNYMRYEAHERRKNPLFWLLGILVGIYVLQAIVRMATGAGYLEAFGALSLGNLASGFIWTLFTYGFLHDPNSPFHLLMNGLGLFFLGRVVQAQYGNRRFLQIFAVGVLAGGLAFLVLRAGSGYLIGASAGVMALFAVFCQSNWNQNVTMLVAFIPVTLLGRYIFWGAVAIEGLFLLSELGGHAYWAASAHLGGIAGGWLFYRYAIERKPLYVRKSGKPVMEKPVWARKKVATPATTGRYKVNVTDRKELQAEVDRILDKINTQGFGSLSEEEKRVLDRARDILNH